MSPSKKSKPTKYYVDFENVHGAGLKGIDDLGKDDQVLVFFSQAAETFHIEQAIDILKSKASVEFVEIDGGTRNSLDFQLVAALFGTMDDAHEYAIVSGDGGFDAAIRMGERLELSPIRRITDLTGSTEQPPAKKSSRSRRRSTTVKDTASEGKAATAGKAAPEGKAATETALASTPGSEDKSAPEADPAAEAKSKAKPKSKSKAKSDIGQNGAPEPAASATPDATDATDAEAEPDASATPARSGRYSKRKEIKAHLAEDGVTLNQQQLSTVMKALNGVKNKQGFYRAIIQMEKQERGLELYRKVSSHYEAMVDILRS